MKNSDIKMILVNAFLFAVVGMYIFANNYLQTEVSQSNTAAKEPSVCCICIFCILNSMFFISFLLLSKSTTTC